MKKIKVENIEIKYQDNMYFQNIEKKFNKIRRIKMEPYIESIAVQYFLREYYGDHTDIGILPTISNYLEEIENDSNTVLNNKPITKKLSLYKEKAEKLYSLINKEYLKYISIAKKEKYCLLCKIEYLHKIQIKTFDITKNKKLREVNEHIITIKQELEHLSSILNKEYPEIIKKLFKSQSDVLEHQIEVLLNN